MKQKSSPHEKSLPSRLQRELSAGILGFIQAEELAPGLRKRCLRNACRCRARRSARPLNCLPVAGWCATARDESYRYRMLIEPAGLLEPGFQLDPGWIADMRRCHRDILAMPWRDTTSIALYEMNAAFHEGLAAASGNRYLLVAVQQQNRLRRFANYDWAFGYERVVVNCREHLAILDRLEAGERGKAAALMRRHLEGAAKVKRTPEGGPQQVSRRAR